METKENLLEQYVTVNTYTTILDANLDKIKLECQGVNARLLDENTVGMASHLSTAVGGVKLQVPQNDDDVSLIISSFNWRQNRLIPQAAWFSICDVPTATGRDIL